MTDKAVSKKKSVPAKDSDNSSCADGSGMDLIRFNKEKLTEKADPTAEEIRKFGETEFVDWLNVCGLDNQKSINELCKNLKIHSLTLDDILEGGQRPKFQEFDDYNFFSMKSILPSRYPKIDSEQINFVLGKNYLVSLHDKKIGFFDQVRLNLRESKGIIRERGADFLLYQILDAILDNYFQILHLLEKDIEHFEINYQKLEPTPLLLKRLELYRRHVNLIKRTIFPLTEFTKVIENGHNTLIEKKHLKYYYDLNYRCSTIIDTCESIESDLESHINLFFSVQGYKLNDVMKTLTMVATIFIPLTFIAGVYGMNFPNMPEIHWKYGYLSFWIVIVASLAGMIYFIKKKKWF